MDKDKISCLTEAELDTYEIHTRRKMEDLLSEGKIAEAEVLKEVIEGLDHVNVCAEDIDYSEVREPRRMHEEPGTMGYF